MMKTSHRPPLGLTREASVRGTALDHTDISAYRLQANQMATVQQIQL